VSRRRVAVLASTDRVRAGVRQALAAYGWEVEEHAPDGRFNGDLSHAEMAVLECTPRTNDPGMRAAQQIRLRNGRIRIIILANESSEDLAIEALRIGAVEYLKPPFDFSRLKPPPEPQAAKEKGGMPEIAMIGESPAMVQIKNFIPRVAASDTNVLVLGETGTGKEMVANLLHRMSGRCGKPFVCVNCAAFPDSLLESELFGHEKGAFTGAIAARDGKLAQAHGGTLFFDEIGDMSIQAQAKILRAIESKEFCRLGGERRIRVDVRIVAATNRDLETLMREERFRADLYFRLNVARIHLPPLRERRADIPLLIEHLLPHYNRVFASRVKAFEGQALESMMNYIWPGNVRELKNVMEIVFLNSHPHETVVWRLPEQVLGMWRKLQDLPGDERGRLIAVLLSTHWNVSEAARKLHWSRMTMYRKLARYSITPEREGRPKRKAVSVDGESVREAAGD
jgi:DNA-binding NtrC family response regulator